MIRFLVHRIVIKAAARLYHLALTLALPVALMLMAGTVGMAQQTTAQFASGVSTPQGGLVLSGTAINPATGNPFRHLWTADAVNGLCRLDPDVDTVGLHAINSATCVNTVAGVAFNAGQLTFDAATNTIYAVDGGSKVGIFIVKFLPGGDTGHGLIDPVNQSILASTGTGAGATSGCGIATAQPTATSIGPDGNLYVGFKRNGNIMRIISPLTNPLPCTNVQPTVITTADRLTSQMAWVGHSMFLNDSRVPLVVNFADQCFTPQNGIVACSAQSIALAMASPTTVVSDQTAGQLNGADVYFGGITVTAITGLTQNPFIGLTGGTTQLNFGGTSFSTIGALVLDSSDPTNNVLYVGDDPTAGSIAGSGRWWQVLSAPPPPAPPSAPLNVTATAGNASATLTWSAPVNHQPVTSYTVHDTFASNSVLVPDGTVTAVPGSTVVPATATVTGLVNGVTYQFEVLASNAQGSGPLSAPSNLVTPQAPTVPGAPTNVSASSSDASASVSWTAPTSNGGSPITSYTVTALVTGAPTGISATVGGGATGAVVAGLTNGLAYTFSVHATNAIGNGPESTQSAAVTPAAITAPDMSIAMSGPASVIAGGNAVYSMVVTNLGTSTASAVTVNDVASGATVSSVATTQGACTTVGTSITCNLGAVGAGNSVTITVTLKPTAQVSNQASVQSAGDPNAANNVAAVTTAFIPLNQTTDVQVVGSAQNGGPSVTGSDTFTWQSRNNQSLTANSLQFTSTLASGMVFQNVSSNMGTCAAPAPGSAGATITCNVAALSGGQTMIVTVTVIFNSVGSMSTSGQASFAGTDNNPANNSASVTIGVK